MIIIVIWYYFPGKWIINIILYYCYLHISVFEFTKMLILYIGLKVKYYVLSNTANKGSSHIMNARIVFLQDGDCKTGQKHYGL